MKTITKIILAFIVYAPCVFSDFSAFPNDHVLFEGKMYPINHYPLDGFFKQNPGTRPMSADTCNERGYYASFTITNNTLVLVDVKPEDNECTYGKPPNESIKKDIFPNAPLVTIDWFTGILVLPSGKITKGGEASYSHFILIEIKHGNVEEVRRLNHTQLNNLKNEYFSAYKKTDEYQKLLAEMKLEEEMVKYFDVRINDSIFDGYVTCFLDKTNSPNQKLDPTVKTPFESGNEQGTAGQL